MGWISHFLRQANNPAGATRAGATRSGTTRFRGGARYLVRALLLAAAYFLTARLSSHFFALPPEPVSPLWPPAALAAVACLGWGWQMAPAIWIGQKLSPPAATRVPMATSAAQAGMMSDRKAIDSAKASTNTSCAQEFAIYCFGY